MSRDKWTEWNFESVFEKASFTGLKAVGLMLEGAAARLVPVDTGRLRGSITHAIRGGRSAPRSPAQTDDQVSAPRDDDTLHVGTNVEYAAHIEYGTRRNGAQPFLRPALDNKRRSVRELYNRELKRVLNGGG